ncbi:glycosyltransferase family 4 protein [Bizionia sediminis]|uniref:Glycosyltransferase family 4 protein n=1 Tax=Bizionia sediminis TaxID=1737064 RepID=A0ABW5KNT7_9FLAO
MINVLYIGNNLKTQTTNVSAISVLGPLLAAEGFKVNCASSKVNKWARLTDMVCHVFKHAKSTDVVLIDTYSTTNFLYAVIISQLCRMLNMPYVPILHGGKLPARLRDTPRLSGLLFKHAHQLVSPSKYLEAAFNQSQLAPVVYIPNSLNIDNYPFKKRNYATINLLWVRSFSSIYNPQLAIKSLKLLKDTGLPCHLCMVGPDTQDGSLQACKQLAQDMQVEVSFMGKLSKPDWIRLSSDYNIFLNTANFDNMPVSVLEAMALGLPVISTSVGGMPHLITNNSTGLLVPANNPVAIKNAVMFLKEHPQQANTLAVKARQMVTNLDWKIVKHSWVTLFSEISKKRA